MTHLLTYISDGPVDLFSARHTLPYCVSSPFAGLILIFSESGKEVILATRKYCHQKNQIPEAFRIESAATASYMQNTVHVIFTPEKTHHSALFRPVYGIMTMVRSIMLYQFIIPSTILCCTTWNNPFKPSAYRTLQYQLFSIFYLLNPLTISHSGSFRLFFYPGPK